METTMLTPDQELECRKLKAIFLQKSPLSQKAFAEKYGFGSPANLGQYLNGRRPLNVSLSAKLAKVLGVDIADFSVRLAREAAELGISTGSSANVAMLKTKQNKKVPILSYVQAGTLTGQGQILDKLKAIDVGDFINVDDDYPDDVFALIIRGSSMEPEFKDGDTIVINPSLRPEPGDFVVAGLLGGPGDDPEATFKKYRPRGYSREGNETFELVPLNDDYPTISSEITHCQIIGVMIEHRRQYRRR